VSAGTRLPLLRRVGDAIEVLAVEPAPTAEELLALRAELDATRHRAHHQIPPIAGTQPSYALPPPKVAGTQRVPLGVLAELLAAAEWESLGLPNGLGGELRAAFVANTDLSAAHAHIVRAGDDALSLARFSACSETVARQAMAELAATCADAEAPLALLDLPAALLASEALAAGLRGLPAVSALGVGQLPVSAACKIGAAWVGLAAACEASPGIETLYVRSQRVRSAEAALLFEALARAGLRSLDMSGTAAAGALEPPPAATALAAAEYGAKPV